MDFNKRTAVLIFQWASRAKCMLLHHRILREIFKEAWREGHVTFPGGNTHTKKIRTFRNRAWWNSVKHEPFSRRSKHGAVHATMGNYTEWEDVFIMVFGPGWSELRDTCNFPEWMSRLPFFINSVCEQWELPVLPSSSASEPQHVEVREKRRRTTSMGDMPSSHSPPGQELEFDFGTFRGRFVFVVDCEPLCEVVCGRSPLNDPSLEPLLVNITNSLQSILFSGWLPPQKWHDPVLWRRRAHNRLADFLVNYTMDTKQSWTSLRDIPDNFGEHNISCHSDGGTRRGACSATGWVIQAWRRHGDGWEHFTLATGGTYFYSPISSFSAETAALAECTSIVRRLVEARSSAKRRKAS